MPSRSSTSSSPIDHAQRFGHAPTVPQSGSVAADQAAQRAGRAARPWARIRRRPCGAPRRRWRRRSPTRSATTRGRQGSAASCCASVEAVAVGQADVDEHRLGPQLGRPHDRLGDTSPASPTTTSPHDRRVLAARSRKEASSSTTSTELRHAPPSWQRARRMRVGPAGDSVSGLRVWRAGARRVESAWHAQGAPGWRWTRGAQSNSRHGAIRSIASARRQRSRRPVSRHRHPGARSSAATPSAAPACGRLLEDDADLAVDRRGGEQSRGAPRSCAATDPDVVLLDAGLA